MYKRQTLDGYVLYENQNYVPMGFTYDYYLTETQYEDTVTPTRSNLLMRALAVSYTHLDVYKRQAVQSLETLNRAAVFHPTGTGKRCIAWKVVELSLIHI